jgi:hypothetical protein
MTDKNEQKQSDDNEIVWGAPQMAPVINRSTRATYHLISKGLLDVTKVGAIHTSTKGRLRRSLGN